MRSFKLRHNSILADYSLTLYGCIGIDGRLLQETSSLGITLSETSGEFLFETDEYAKWVQHGKALSTPEPLSSCIYLQVISRADMERALTALVDLAAAAASTDGTSMCAYCICLMRSLEDTLSNLSNIKKHTMHCPT